MAVNAINRMRDWIFRQVHSNHLVYNTCWEDPRCDRQLLALDDTSEVVMITSAGCNALDYLLDHPKRIHCVDMNPRQNALLHLKLATYQQAAFSDLFHMFGQGEHAEIASLYHEQLREAIPPFARQFWDKNLHYFNGRGIRQSFYHYGTSGAFAWLTGQYLRTRRGLFRQIEQLFEAETLEKQIALYYNIEKRAITPLIEWFVNQHFTMCLIGVPQSQQQLFRHQYQRGTLGFIQECLRKVFTRLHLQDNYFWKVYFKGHYSPDCCPSYLAEENFPAIHRNSHRISIHNTTISSFLKENPGRYSHFVLLDHQDWLATHDRPALEEEWKKILANSRPGARILLRSAAAEVRFFPEFVLDAVTFEKEKTQQMHRQDRVGTYASVYLGIVND